MHGESLPVTSRGLSCTVNRYPLLVEDYYARVVLLVASRGLCFIVNGLSLYGEALYACFCSAGGDHVNTPFHNPHSC